VPLIVLESETAAVQALAGGDAGMLVWCATEAESASAIARLEIVTLDDRLAVAARKEGFSLAGVAA
jgi:hypothetical protein